MNKIGIYFAYWERNWNADYIKYIHKVKKLGFDVLETEVGALCRMTDEEKIRISKEAEYNGIELTYCIGLPAKYDIASLDENTRNNGKEYVKDLLRTINIMGGDMIGGIIYSCWPKTDETYDNKKRLWENSVNSVRELAGIAEEYGITYNIEIVNRFEQLLINTVDEGLKFIKETDRQNVKLLLDTFHMNIEEDNIGKAIESAKGHIGHFHIGECNRKTPGNGHMPWDEIMSSIKKAEYTGRIVMEPFIKTGGEVGRDIRVYRDLSDGADYESMDLKAKRALQFIKDRL